MFLKRKSQQLLFLFLFFVLLFSQNKVGCVCTDPENSNNLEEFFTCIFENYGSEGDRSEFDLPEDQISSWQQVVEDMIKTEIECKSIDLRTLAETTNFKIEEHHGFCILYDTLLESGLSSFVVRKNGTRAVILSAPHPRFDYKTCIQAASIMDIFPAQMLIIAGSRRDTCLNASTCQSNYYVADRAHNTLGDYYGAIEIVKEIFSENNLPELSQIDFHGMSTTTCNGTDVLLSEGIKVEPQDDSLLMKIKESLQEQTSWSIHNYGEQHECDLYGTTNVMGRLYNGVNSNEVCGTFADESYGRFVHIEQKYFIRTDRDTDAFYKNAFLNAFESDSCLPTRELINDKCVIKSDPDPDPDPDPHTESSSLLVSFSQIIFFLQIIFFVLFKR
ncbi:hypothetical protein M0813_03364 [Anaeramoeba flamelloides]|uniref:Uncharacterized protein n=1 Tax=Anaeramoeba flamelloides TaxID=1746091 RepID=A0ABQ8Y0R6_9EUKA|nr:hypothetical protein M0813_03364 [Anaeramoeba flamelloides]